MKLDYQEIIYLCYDVVLNTRPLNGYMGVEYPHITLAFKPNYAQYINIITNNPTTFKFKVVGYGLNETNEAIEVTRPLNCLNDTPHVTISHKGRPVDSNRLTFNPIDQKILDERKINAEFDGVLTIVTKNGRYAVKDIEI